MTTAIVPMKAISQRLPGKNVASLGDKPLCYWLLNTLIACKHIDKIIVDAWGKEIIECVEQMPGAKDIVISQRPIEYCIETAGGNFLLERFVTDPDEIYVQCHVTSPFLHHETIGEAVHLIKIGDCESCFGVTKIQQRLWLDNEEQGSLSPINHRSDEPLARTQDLDEVYAENGSFFAFTGNSYFTHDKSRNCFASRPIPLSFPETIDIDEEDDLALARAVISAGLTNF